MLVVQQPTKTKQMINGDIKTNKNWPAIEFGHTSLYLYTQTIANTASASNTYADNEPISLPHTATVTIDQHNAYSAPEHQYTQL